MADKQHLTQLLNTHQRSLQILQQQAAFYGSLNVPPHIQLQLEDLQKEIANLQQQLGLIPVAKIENISQQPHTPYFTGREEELQFLESSLVPGNTVAIIGLGGMGKTQFSLAYANRHLPEFDLAWFITAEPETSLRTGLEQLARQLGITVPEQESALSMLKSVLAQEQRRWLLILDNADDDPANFLTGMKESGCIDEKFSVATRKTS